MMKPGLKLFSKFDAVAFFSNILAVILGIAITFSIQGLIDYRNEKKNVESALRLVKEELASCRSDLDDCVEFLQSEAVAARYLKENASRLSQCPPDSVSKYGMTFISELVLTLPSDAMELLKTSSLFSSVGDNELSLKIIRAYDQCQVLLAIFNKHEAQKSEVLEKIFLTQGIDKTLREDGSVSISELVNTNEGKYLLLNLMGNTAGAVSAGFKDIDNAIESIDKYLGK